MSFVYDPTARAGSVASTPTSTAPPASVTALPSVALGPQSPTSTAAAESSGVRLMSWEEFDKETLGNANVYFWEGMIPSSGVVLVVGEAMTGKTALCVTLAAAAHEGATVTEVAGLEVEERRFLFVMLEHGPDLKEYVRRAAKSFGISTVGFCVACTLDLGDEDMVADLDNKADAANVDVIVIDCLRRATDLDENVSGDMADVGRALRRLTRSGRRLVIATHHLAKDGSVRGSTDLTAQADSVLTVRKRGSDLELQSRHHGAAERSLTLRLDFSGDGLTAVVVQGKAPTVGPSASMTDIVDAVHQAIANSHRTQNAVRKEARRILQAKRIGVQNASIDGAISQLAGMGRIVDRNAGVKRTCDWVIAAPSAVDGS
jgi:archaellum biogenesis ATPase FlaH